VSADDDLKALVARITDFKSWTPANKILLFAWVNHAFRNKTRFSTGDIGWCYEKLDYKKPNISQYLGRMEGKELLHDASGYYLEGSLRSQYDAKYGEHEVALNVRQMVKDLVKVVPEIGEQDMFKEALICLTHDAVRASVIMVWNIAFYHLCRYVMKHKLNEFNNRLPTRFPKKWKITDLPVITKYEDFADNMSEREVIEVCNSASIIDGNMHQVFVDKLNARNSAAHPSTIHVTQVQAEGYIDGLIRNVVLLLKI
jgi:hypothetical protein